MPPDKIRPYNDPRIQHCTTVLNGYTYGYLLSHPPPNIPNRGAIVLIHGFPDLSMGWRYQIPFLTSLGLTCIAPDCLGYGRSDAPPMSKLSAYSYKRIADDVATLCQQLGLSKILLGGHDWGGAIVYRIAQYHPDLVMALFSVCTPYPNVTPVYEPLALRVKHKLPNLGYQLQFASGEVEERVQSRTEIRQFLEALYGGRGPNGEIGWNNDRGLLFDNFPSLGHTPLLDQTEMDYYVSEYARHGVNGPLNWYRTGEINYLDELHHFFQGDADFVKRHGWGRVPNPLARHEVLFVLATRDTALVALMAERMPERIPKLTRGQVQADHWALWQKPEEVNRIIGDWLRDNGLLLSSSSSSAKGKL